MIHRLFATPNRRVIIALVTVLFVLNALVFFVVRTREMTVARLQLNQNQNKPNGLTLVTANASTDVQVTLESNVASLSATERDVPVKIMVSKPANTVLSALAVELKYDTSKFDPPTITTDASCNVMQQLTPTPLPTNTPTNTPTATPTPVIRQIVFTPQFTCPTNMVLDTANTVVSYQVGVTGVRVVNPTVNEPIQMTLDEQKQTGYVFVTLAGQQVAPSSINPTSISSSNNGSALANTWDVGTMFNIPNTFRVWLGMSSGAYSLVYDASAVQGACIPSTTVSPQAAASSELRQSKIQNGVVAGVSSDLIQVGAGVLDVEASSQLVQAVKFSSEDRQTGITNFCLAKATFKTRKMPIGATGRIEVVASGGDTRIETLPVSGTTMGTVEGQQYVEVTKADPGYTITSPAYDVRMTGTVALTIKKPDEQIKRGDEFYIDIMAKPTVPEGAFVGMSALEFDFGYGAAIGADGVPTSKVFITKFDTSQSPECSILEHVLPVVTDGYTVTSQRPTIRYSKAGHTGLPTTDFCVGRIYMKAMETGLVQMSIKTGDGIALDARGRKMTIQNTNGIASSISLDVVPSTIVDPSCEDLRLNVDTNDQQTYVRPQQAVVISMNTGLAYKILADKGTGITLKNPPKRFTYTAPMAEGPDRIQIWRTDNTYCEPEITVQSNANGSVSSLDGVYIDPNKVSVRMKIRPQGVIKGRLPYTKLKVAIAAGGLPTNNNLIDPVSNEFVSIGEGMFEGIVTFDPRYIKPGKGYKLIVKGSKHLAKRICEPEPNKSKTKPDSAYSCPKDNAGVFEFKNGLNGPYDFTKVYLPAGDLFIDRQDGVIDSTDLTFIRKHLGSQDPEFLRIGDINMDGQIDTQDYLITISNVVNNLDEN